MNKNALHHSPVRNYSHSWGVPGGEMTRTASNRLPQDPELADADELPLADLSTPESGTGVSRRSRFASLTRKPGAGRTGRSTRPARADKKQAPLRDTDALETRLSRLRAKLIDYRLEAETEIIDRTSDAVVHLDKMANEYRAGVRAELEKFRDETGDQSLLHRSLVESALRRLNGRSAGDQVHHSVPDSDDSSQDHSGGPVFFNYLPRPETEK